MKDARFRSAYAAGAVTAQDVLEFHRRTFGPARMEDPPGPPANPSGQGGDTPPERPEGVTEEEWTALGDPGKRAIVRERDRATRAEQEAAALRSSRQPQPPKPAPPKDDKGGQQSAGSQQEPEPTDIAKIVQQAVAAALQPIQERDQQREADDAARAVAQSVTTAAATKLHDASDALTNIDLTTLTDGSGRPDATKITTALDDLVQRKPHLAKVVDPGRHPAPGHVLGGAPAPVTSEDDRVKAALAKMQAAAGVKLAGA